MEKKNFLKRVKSIDFKNFVMNGCEWIKFTSCGC